MENYSKEIREYGLGIDNFEVSPFESVNTLHTRSYLEEVLQELTNEEKVKLYGYDMVLIQNAKKMAKHIEEIYDFAISTEPLSEWWWHLDKVSSGEITFNISIDVDSNVAM